jgi:hypothetical protein
VSDQTYKQDIETGGLSSARGVTDPLGAVKQIHSRVLNAKKLVIATGVELADAAVGTATAETRGATIPFAGVVTGVKLTLHGAVAGNAADGFTMTISKRDAAGINLTTIATISSVNAVPASGNFVAFLGKAATLVNAALQVAAGGMITWSIAKNGAGVVVPTFDLDVTVLDQ